jgi:hypothetical protein
LGAPGYGLPEDDRLFTLDVFIIGGPMARRFLKKNKVVSRTIQIRGDQTLECLHCAIFDAFKRSDQHWDDWMKLGTHITSASLFVSDFRGLGDT